MENIKSVLQKYNPILIEKLIKSDLQVDEINSLIKQKTEFHLPSDVIDLYQTFNGTLLNYENENGLYLRVEPNCFFFGNGYLLDLETAISIFEKNKKRFVKKAEVHFPIFGTGFDIYYTIILNNKPDDFPDEKGVFKFIIGKSPSKVYDTFSSFINTIIQSYEQGIYFINSNNMFISKTYEEYQLKEKNNPNSKPWL